MSNSNTRKSLAIAAGAALVTSLASASAVNAAENPFAMTELPGGYMVAESHVEGKCGEGKCGGAKKEGEGKCGEGKCGGAAKSAEEGKCGEGKCGGAKKEAEGTAGEDN
jgi:uncharacterized low-complexity protein